MSHAPNPQDIRNLAKIQRVRCLLAHSASIWGAALVPAGLGAADTGSALVTCAGGCWGWLGVVRAHSSSTGIQ
jgi:hypothetical protein